MTGMGSGERRLWRVVGAMAAVCIVIAALCKYFFVSRSEGIVFLVVGLFVLGGRPDLHRDFQSLSRANRVLLILTIAATGIAVIVIGNFGQPDSWLFDLVELAALAVLLLLYSLFSKAMDALWLRFVKR